MKKAESELIYYARTLDPKLKTIILIPISDVHYGNPTFSINHFKRTVEYIESVGNAYTILNGDMCESAIKTSKGEIYKQVGTPQDQRDWIIEQLYPIREKVLAMTTGNHENRIYNDVGIDISADIASALNVPYRPEGLLFKISFGNYNKNVKGKPYVSWGYFTHGYGGARTKASKAVKVERTSSWVLADWYAMSHDHVVNAAPDVMLIPDNRTREEGGFMVGKVVEKRKELIKTNAYMKWGGYSEMGGFPPVDMSAPVVLLLTPKSPEWSLIPEKPHQAVRVIV